MDTDWCLTCETHFEGNGPYCSRDCQTRAGPSSFPQSSYHVDSDSASFDNDDLYDDEIIYHQVDDAPRCQWNGNGYTGILAWASEIPTGVPAGADASSLSDEIAPLSSPSTSSLGSITYRAPQLLRPNRPIPPTLCMSTPRPAPSSPSRPIVTPQQHMAALSIAHSGDTSSMGKTSLLSGATESSIATPASANPVPISASRRPSMLHSITSQVRSWVAPSSQIPSPSNVKQRILPSSASKRPTDSQTFNVLARKVASSSPSSFDASDDEHPPVWYMSSAIFVNAPKGASKPSRGRQVALDLPLDDHPSYRARGRKASRTAA
ncbi:hypothetical protein BDQ12DRAFT_722224 [Crucibulum laeve]|uniref:Uncharacterized protein n=1 Tax=Crucibulum laeve TaxID=68775 RepID=A0A5C3M2G8_9AGAR|nr:hypothetical protein BDQ12DRAFT_722224 [Crucibulum laeve]